ncbi:Uncharacterised protein [Enterobacter asburiae]|uniref:Uncharacterized protein n=1 Tax=Enterobacter asburiae TaxID=61645 RepID=A0A376F3H0_ENTAS|nr:Uncharacterised protein [Enterobacter asburiae]
MQKMLRACVTSWDTNLRGWQTRWQPVYLPNEVTKVFASIAREVEVHRKDAEAKGDSQHANYLSKRLRRLTTIKDERLKELNKAQEKTA